MIVSRFSKVNLLTSLNIRSILSVFLSTVFLTTKSGKLFQVEHVVIGQNSSRVRGIRVFDNGTTTFSTSKNTKKKPCSGK